jgi:hypothetical protein
VKSIVCVGCFIVSAYIGAEICRVDEALRGCDWVFMFHGEVKHMEAIAHFKLHNRCKGGKWSVVLSYGYP